MPSPIPVLVDNRVRIRCSRLTAEQMNRLCDRFTYRNPSENPDPAYYRTYEMSRTNREISFPRGGMQGVREVLSGHELDITDARSAGNWKLLDDDWGGRIPDSTRKMWDFQDRVIAGMRKKQNCIVQAGTGTGKTSAAIALISRVQVPTLVIVNTGGLMSQWIKRVSRELGVEEEQVGVIGDGQCHTAPVTIAMQQTLARGIDPIWISAFGMIICDECDLFSAPTFYDAVDPWTAKYRIGMTATVERHDRKTFMVRDLFGETVAEVTREEAIEKGKIVEVDIYVVPTEFKADWYRRAVMSGNRFHIMRAHQSLTKALWQDEGRNDLVDDLVAMETSRGNQVIVFSSRREHCAQMDRRFTMSGLRSGLMLGGAEGREQFVTTTDRVNRRELDVVVGTEKAIGRGQDFPSISVGVVAMPFAKNDTLVSQLVGRVCRSSDGKTGGRLYFLWDRHVHGKSHVEHLVKNNRNVYVRNEAGGWDDAKDVITSMQVKRKSYVEKARGNANEE